VADSSGPGAYESPLVTKKKEPQWTMGGKYDKDMNKGGGPSPDCYQLPSKIVEKQG